MTEAPTPAVTPMDQPPPLPAVMHTPARDRDHGVDALRGFAVLGLMAVHVMIFGRPMSVILDPRGGLEYEGVNQTFIWFSSVFAQGKFMFLFALLFGAAILYFDRKSPHGAEPTPLSAGMGLWYRRMGWLAAIGFLHGTLLFFGDILVLYAITGMAALWWVRRFSTAALLWCGAGCYMLAVFLLLGFMLLTALMMSDESNANLFGDLMSTESQMDAVLGSWWEATKLRVVLFGSNIMNIPFLTIWLTTGIMMTGMALARTGILTGKRSSGFYGLLLVGGLVVGLITSGGLFHWVAAGDFGPYRLAVWTGLFQLVGIPLSFAYIGGIMLIARTRTLRFISIPLAAVGRMALSNYLLHSVLGAFIFQGWGLGHFGTLEFPELAVISLIVWTINIIFSLLWLSIFRFGPMEWLWRSLTYGKLQPLR